jgi:carboxylesterase type B
MFAVAHGQAPLNDSSSLRVEIAGGVVHGGVDGATPEVRQFQGIPYARPPLGALRFAPPEPAPAFGELEATTMPPSCMQYLNFATPTLMDDVPEINVTGLNGTTGHISEDCLTLSIWAPLRSVQAQEDEGEEGLLPVLVFFYGGAFATGGVDVPYQLPGQWVQRTQSHVVVSFNHRENIFGFPNAAGIEADQQNVGLMDERLAIEWVRDNIAAFGGDPGAHRPVGVQLGRRGHWLLWLRARRGSHRQQHSHGVGQRVHRHPDVRRGPR